MESATEKRTRRERQERERTRGDVLCTDLYPPLFTMQITAHIANPKIKIFTLNDLVLNLRVATIHAVKLKLKS